MTLQELGQNLQEKREAAGLSIDDVASRIKVSGRILRTIEQGSMDGLPHAIYTKSFIHSFGMIIGYEQEELRRHLDQVFPPETLDESKKERVLLMSPVMTSTGGGKTVILLCLLVLILLGLGAGGWYVAKYYGTDIVNFVKQPFSAISFSSGGDARRPGDAADPVSVLPSQTQPSSEAAQPVQPSSIPSEQEGAQPNPAPPAPSPAQAPAPTSQRAAPVRETSALAVNEAIAATETGENQMLIVAQRTCWIGPTVDGQKLAPFTLKSGEQHKLVYSRSLELVLGNPSGIRLSLNGTDLGTPAPGERVLQFP